MFRLAGVKRKGSSMIDDSHIDSECHWIRGDRKIRVRVLIRDKSADSQWVKPGSLVPESAGPKPPTYLVEVLEPDYQGSKKVFALAMNLEPITD